MLGELAGVTREAAADAAHMQVSSDGGTLLTMPTRPAGVSSAVEVCVLTGYSTLCIACGPTDGGRLRPDLRRSRSTPEYSSSRLVNFTRRGVRDMSGTPHLRGSMRRMSARTRGGAFCRSCRRW
ncbi:hypothetical protein [Streptomyces canarius]|uniref:hypothetical protein n=1 Tax=Streptomyces canarius TaxID=285453 RepID=UPI0035712CEB